MTVTRKKLIEVALPLPEINDASAYDKMPGIGPHPKGIHHWWARLPLPTARAVLFASIVDDPSAHPEKWPTEEVQSAERERLFDIIRRLMGKKLHEHPEVYAEARAEMLKHCDGRLPSVFDPFAGGGSIPLEANRLGLETRAADLNPVAVLINKALLEIAPTWAGQSPVNPLTSRNEILANAWKGTKGLSEDIRHYSNWVLDRAEKALRPFYRSGPGGRQAVAWMWCRTVASPNPACRGAHVPLVRSLKIAKKQSQTVWVEPVVNRNGNEWHFRITDEKPTLAGTVGRGGGTCVISETPIPLDYIRSEGKAGRLGLRLMAVVGDGRDYYSADEWPEFPAPPASDFIVPETMPNNPFAVRPPLYGLRRFCDVFTPRQLHSLGIFSDLVKKAREQVLVDALPALGVERAGTYADAVATFLSFIVDRCVDFNNSLCRWSSSNQKVMSTFGRPAIPMIWDFAEANILGESVGSWKACSDYVSECVAITLVGQEHKSAVVHGDATQTIRGTGPALISTDPPYYNNVDYSDLSDFFYVWLRRSLATVYPDLFKTVLTPKTKELVASPYRFDGNKDAARDHFEGGFREIFSALCLQHDGRFPLTVYYAFKQADEKEEQEGQEGDDNPPLSTTTGWETMLEALVGSGLQISGTWPVRASQRWRQMSMGMNALASYIVLSCRPRHLDAKQTDRRSFVAELKRELPSALRHLQQGNIAPVDFAQAAIGPGMAIYSRYSRILESSGKAVTVRTALSLINQTLTEALSEQGDEFDADTRWALAWFEQSGFVEGEYGVAETLSKAKNTSVAGMVDAGILASSRGKVRLLKPDELPANWDPTTDPRLTAWEMVHQLIRALEGGGEGAAAVIVAKLGSKAEIARELCYRLYILCERKKRAAEALAYNGLVQSWPEITRLARESGPPRETQTTMFDNSES
jgi:putative DNA methylase